MRELLSSQVFSVMITLLLYFFSQKLFQKYRFFLFNPVLLTIAGLIFFLKGMKLEYETYFEGAQIISFFLGPAVVALAVPLYMQFDQLKKNAVAILISIVVASVSGILSVMGIAWLLGGSPDVILSLAPKSVTTPIAMGIAEKIGGIPSLTAVLVVITGIFGAVFGPGFMKLIRIKSKIAVGLAIGAASHGVGTSRIVEEGETEGAMGGLAICLNGIATAIFAPILLSFFL